MFVFLDRWQLLKKLFNHIAVHIILLVVMQQELPVAEPSFVVELIAAVAAEFPAETFPQLS